MKIKFLAIFVLSVFLYGCSIIGKALNPYEDQFQCPETEKGKCVSVATAYKESVDKNENNSKGLKELIIEEKKSTSTLTAYEDAVFGKMASLLKEPVPPIVAPPPVIRVLFLSYRGDGNELFMPRFIYFFADEPKWVIGDYILGKDTE